MTASAETCLAWLPLLVLTAASTGCHSYDGSCESSALCDAGTFCLEGRCVAALPAGSCTPPTAGAPFASSVSAPAPGACSPTDPLTWPQPVTPALPAGWVLPLRVDGADDPSPVRAGVGETVSFDLPPGAASVTIHQQGVSAASTIAFFGYTLPNSVAPTAVRAPNGGSIYDDDFAGFLFGRLGEDPSLRTASYLGVTAHTGSFTVPATTRLVDFARSGGALPAGPWSFRVSDWNAQCAGTANCFSSFTGGTYDVTVVARPGPYVSTGTLDVGIYLAGGGALTAAQAIGDPDYQRFVWAIGQILGRAGICLGDVTFFDLPAWAKVTPDIDAPPPCGDLARLFSLASPAVDGVHLFLVDAFLQGGGIVGIDGSIPGPSGLPGAATSGAAMIMGNIGAGACVADQLDIAQCGSDFAAYVAAHEMGHWLGLYHTTERYGDQFDPLDDTASCPCRECAGVQAAGCMMDATFCTAPAGGCGGTDNLMFWQVDRQLSLGRLTAQQALVMRVNPAVR